METSLIEQGGNLMLYGMGMVFVFLMLLVLMMTLMSALIQRFFPEPEAGAAGSDGMGHGAGTGVDARIKKIVQAALDQHRGR